MEIAIAIVVLLIVFGFVFSKKQKNNIDKFNIPTNQSAGESISFNQGTQLSNQDFNNLNQEEHIKLQTQYLKFIAQQTERTAKNAAFFTWMYIISFIIGLLMISSKF
ncbi:hypothetical protein [Myroides odoratimimus]|uniref:hypothetical protein n=1 Tax=Myroides odoratimimus TaxID=76832 RepID=UPI00257628AE|nr:hypothetical protein [Myroides odoratimimus]MDM1535075.1 hypothetical protein [Myroides odoratimimus]MDM1674167.1 hypothetical protein [Myroides odoratimimus]